MRAGHYAQCQRFTANPHLKYPTCLTYRQEGTFKGAKVPNSTGVKQNTQMANESVFKLVFFFFFIILI